jgi:hypothetical protein
MNMQTNNVNIIEQNVTESSHQSLSTTILAVPITIGTESTATPTTININRDVFLELINNRIENNTEVIRDVIEDSIMSLYARMT